MGTIIKFAKIKKITSENKEMKNYVFPVYFQEYDNNWEENIWDDGEGNVYFESELIFVKEPEYYKNLYQKFLDRIKK